MIRTVALTLLGLATLLPEAQAFPLPPPLETAHLVGKGLPSGIPPVPLSDELYVLGWSRTNLFSVLERRSVDGGWSVRWRILNLIEDSVVEDVEWPDWGTDQEQWWAEREAQVSQTFARLGLVPTNWQLGVFPLILDNEYYSLILRPHHADLAPGWLDRLQVLVYSTGRGLKTVKDTSGYWRWASLLGFVPSPFENRVALILLVQPTGWAGTKQPVRFLITGLSLKAGFPKP